MSKPTVQNSKEPRGPTHAERCRTLAAMARSGTLCTIARDPAGFPYGSLVAVAMDGSGRPIFLLSQLAEHTQNLSHREEASLLLTAPPETGRSPLESGRVTLLGPCRRTEGALSEKARRIYLAAHPDAAQYVDFKDFAFYRMEPVALRYVGGFGRMSWVNTEDYRLAVPDPLASFVERILMHMNGDHADALLAYARGLARIQDATAATMTAVDRYGFELAVTTPEGTRTTRLGFEEPIGGPDRVREAMVEMAQKARAALSGSST
jgi:hypothetical protein